MNSNSGGYIDAPSPAVDPYADQAQDATISAVHVCSRCKGKGKIIGDILSGGLKDCPDCTLTFHAVDPASSAGQPVPLSGPVLPSAPAAQATYVSPWLPNSTTFTITRGVEFDKLIKDSGFIKELLNSVELVQIYTARNANPHVDQLCNIYETKLRSMGMIP